MSRHNTGMSSPPENVEALDPEALLRDADEHAREIVAPPVQPESNKQKILMKELSRNFSKLP